MTRYKHKYNKLNEVSVGDRVVVTQYASAESIGTVSDIVNKKAEDGTSFIMIKVDQDSHYDAYKNELKPSKGTIWTSELYERPVYKVDNSYKRGIICPR